MSCFLQKAAVFVVFLYATPHLMLNYVMVKFEVRVVILMVAKEISLLLSNPLQTPFRPSTQCFWVKKTETMKTIAKTFTQWIYGKLATFPIN